MGRTLGLDLGTNSLGWAVLNDCTIEDAGVIVFEQGIPLEKGVEAANSPAAERRLARAARRLKFRRRLRKYHTLKILLENGMCPLTLSELKNWIRNGNFPIDNKDFISWLTSTRESNPYYFRAKAATEKIPPMELGRAFFHIAIRRGFKSSRKDQSNAENEKELGVLKSNILHVTTELKKRGLTLGQYLYELFQQDKKIRREIRTSRTEHYEPEFLKICKTQELSEDIQNKLHNAIFMQRPLRSQKHLVGNCSLEKQRPRCLIAHPLFERYRMLSFINSIRVKLHNEQEMKELTKEQKELVQAVFFVKDSYIKFEKIAKKLYPEIFKKKYDGPQVEFNYRLDTTIASSPVTHQLQKILGVDNLLTWEKTYVDATEKKRVMTIQTLFDGLIYLTNTLDNENALRKFAIDRVGLTEEQTKEFLKIKIPDGYANYSLCAIRKIIPFLECGYIERYAVSLAKIPDIMGDEFYKQHELEIFQDFNKCVADYTWEKTHLVKYEKLLPLMDRIKIMLEEKWKIAPSRLEQLYSFREKSEYADQSKQGILPRIDLGMIYNPVVQRSLTVLRHLVNELRKSEKIDENTHIHLELAREINNKSSRMAYLDWQKENEKSRKEAITAFEEHGIQKPTDEQILRYRLWREQHEICLYTGRKIEDCEIFGQNTNKVDIEHTIPRSRGGDNNMENLTLCDAYYNRHIKGERLPEECCNFASPTDNLQSAITDHLRIVKWESKLEDLYKKFAQAKSARDQQKAKSIKFKLDYWKNKIESFFVSADELNSGFTNRQLVDTGVMTRHALSFLKSVYPHVYSRSGKITAFARQTWGLQDMATKKNRTNHIHHAIDAIVLAALTPEKFSRIAAAFHEDSMQMTFKYALPIAYPWANFPQTVHDFTEGILVRHLTQHKETKQTKRNTVRLATPFKYADGSYVDKVPAQGDTVRGQLHDETYYGRIMDKEGKLNYVVRKKLDAETFKSIDDFYKKIVDQAVANALIQQIQIYLDNGEDFNTALTTHSFHMKTKSGKFDGPVILKVRCFHDPEKERLKIKKHAYPSKHEHKKYLYAMTAKGGNFLVALYRAPQISQKDRIYNYHLISLWNWAEWHRKSDYIRPQDRSELGNFVGFIQPGVSVLCYKDTPDELKNLSPKILSQRLYKLAEYSKEGRMVLRHNQEARSKTDVENDMKEKFKVKSASQISWDSPFALMKLSSKNFQNHLLFEGIDFQIDITGHISFYF